MSRNTHDPAPTLASPPVSEIVLTPEQDARAVAATARFKAKCAAWRAGVPLQQLDTDTWTVEVTAAATSASQDSPPATPADCGVTARGVGHARREASTR